MDQTTLTLPEAEKLLGETLAAHDRSPRTVETYTLMLDLFSRHLKLVCPDKTLDTVTPADIEAYQRYLVTERKVGFSSFNQATCALRFFYRTCLDKADWTIARMPYQRKRRVLPEILSPEEVAAIFDGLPQPQAQGAADDVLQRGAAPARDAGAAPQRHRQPAHGDPRRAGQGAQGPLRDALPDAARRAARLLEGLPARALALRGTGQGGAARPSTAEKVFTSAAGRAGIRKEVYVSLAASRFRDPPARGRHQHPS